MRSCSKLIAGIVLGSALCPSVSAEPMVLTFEGLQTLEPIGDFYNGGLGGNGSGPGPNFGIAFNEDALAIIDADAGGGGNFGGEPSPSTVLFFLSGSAAVMDVAAGFDTGFSFFYSAITNPGSVTVFDGLGGTGNALVTFGLPLTPFNGAPDPTGQFSPLVPIGVAFDGTARSVAFSGVADQIAFDDVTFGAATPGNGNGTVPEPGSLALLCIVSACLFAFGTRPQIAG